MPKVPCQVTILWLIGQVPLRRCTEEMRCRCLAEDEPFEAAHRPGLIRRHDPVPAGVHGPLTGSPLGLATLPGPGSSPG